MTSNSFSLYSYNCRGWRGSSDYVRKLLLACEVCCIQEHWLLSEGLGALNISTDFLSVGVSGIESSELHLGRPFGGCAVKLSLLLCPEYVLFLNASARSLSVYATLLLIQL